MIQIENELAERMLDLRKKMYTNSMAGRLSIWTIYDHPLDFPNKYVARLFEIDDEVHPSPSIIITPDLETMRYIMAYEFRLTAMARDPNDDPKIVEVWL